MFPSCSADELQYYILGVWQPARIHPSHYIDIALIDCTIQACNEIKNTPTISQILAKWIPRLCGEGCACLENAPAHFVHEAFECLLQLPRVCNVLTCGSINVFMLFYQLRNCWPDSVDELIQFIHDIQNNDEVWSTDEKQIIEPTANLEHLPTRIVKDSDQNCSMCQEPIARDTDVFEIPGCGHIFHAIDDQCLGEGCSIITWLQRKPRCPTCNGPVTISLPGSLN